MWESACHMKAIAMLHENKGGRMGDIHKTLWFQVIIRIISLGWLQVQWIIVRNYLLVVGVTTTNLLLHIQYHELFTALGCQFNYTHVWGTISSRSMKTKASSWVTTFDLAYPSNNKVLANTTQILNTSIGCYNKPHMVSLRYNHHNSNTLPILHSWNQMEAVKTPWHYVHNLRHLDFKLHQNKCTHLTQYQT